jgi:hypothetical protein
MVDCFIDVKRMKCFELLLSKQNSICASQDLSIWKTSSEVKIRRPTKREAVLVSVCKCFCRGSMKTRVFNGNG